MTNSDAYSQASQDLQSLIDSTNLDGIDKLIFEPSQEDLDALFYWMDNEETLKRDDVYYDEMAENIAE